MRTPEIELWWWEGCPSTQRALDELRAAMRELDLDADAIRTREIRTDSEADQAGYTGSPTILIDGVDLVAGAGAGAARDQPGSESGLTCRVFRRRDGRISPTPDPDDLREALRQAAVHPREARG